MMIRKLIAALATALLVLSACPTGAEWVQFKNGGLTTSSGLTVTTYGANGEVGMCTIGKAKGDSCIGKRAVTTTAQEHFIGNPSVAQKGITHAVDTLRVMCKFDISLLAGVTVSHAELRFPQIGGVGLCGVTGCVAHCAPLADTRCWRTPTTQAGAGYLWVSSAVDSNPTWNEYKWTAGYDSSWTKPGASAIRMIDYDPGDAADQWAMGDAEYTAYSGYDMFFDVTRDVRMSQEDSLDLTHAGWLIRLEAEGTDGTYAKLHGHWCTDASKRPSLKVWYVDTLHVNRSPLRLGENTVGRAPDYYDTPARPTQARFAVFSDTHTCTNSWAVFDRVIEQLIAMSPRPAALFHLGDIIIAPAVSAHTESLLTRIGTLRAAGIDFFSALGNHEFDASYNPQGFTFAQNYLPGLYGETYFKVDLGACVILVANNNTGFTDPGVAPASEGCPGDSLTDLSSPQASRLVRELHNTRPEIPAFVGWHKCVWGPMKALRYNLRDFAKGAADSLCNALECAGMDGNFAGHQHAWGVTNPLYHNVAADTIDVRTTNAAGTLWRKSADDSASVYFTVAVAAGGAVRDNLVARGQIRRWSAPLPSFTLVDVIGANWYTQAIDTSGAVFDTLAVCRRD